jgi:hypothetical protein
MKRRQREPNRKYDPTMIYKRVRFDSAAFKRLEDAANRRGIGWQEFIRLACSVAVDRVMALPPDEALGRIGPESTNAAA